jgi:FtsP/CotA-like multicopper oxidase with cupredoxin domain
MESNSEIPKNSNFVPNARLKGVTRRTALLAGLGAAAAPAFAQRSQGHHRPNPNFNPPAASPPRPWEKYARDAYPPGEPGKDYTPVFTPNGVSLPFKVVDGVKVYHLIAEEIVHEVAPGLVVNAWGYNGRTTGPTIEAVQGDRVRIYVTNRLAVPTSVHWHAIILPNGMDGVASITQPAIPPGATYVYEFIFPDAGTFMYHPHYESMTEEGMGMTGMLIVHPRNPKKRPDRDFALMLHEWSIEGGSMRPNPFEMTDFNVLTINGRAAPGTYPLVAQLGDNVRIRIGNLSAMDHHPIHLHGYAFKVTETDGGPIPESAQWPETTVLVHVGSTRTIEFHADNPGDWIMHCHMTHHTMNQMGHDLPNMIGVETGDLDKKIQKILPDYMTMGQHGMAGMEDMRMPVPENSIPMLGVNGQYGGTVMGSMFTMLKVREKTNGYEDPGWYEHPDGTVSYPASSEQLRRDGIRLG